MYLNKWACVYFISKTKYIKIVISLSQKSSLPLLSSAQSSKLSFILSISASVIVYHKGLAKGICHPVWEHSCPQWSFQYKLKYMAFLKGQ